MYNSPVLWIAPQHNTFWGFEAGKHTLSLLLFVPPSQSLMAFFSRVVCQADWCPAVERILLPCQNTFTITFWKMGDNSFSSDVTINQWTSIPESVGKLNWWFHSSDKKKLCFMGSFNWWFYGFMHIFAAQTALWLGEHRGTGAAAHVAPSRIGLEPSEVVCTVRKIRVTTVIFEMWSIKNSLSIGKWWLFMEFYGIYPPVIWYKKLLQTAEAK